MKDDVLQRIRGILKSERISITALSKEIGMPQTTLNRQISGEGIMPLDTICMLLDRFPNISAEWLLRGKDSYKIKPDDKRFLIIVDENGFLKLME